MSIGEWVSVQSARELNRHQIAIERQELQDAPAEEQEELSLIYQSKGLDERTAKELATNLMQQSNTALDTLAREELGINPKELGGSAWGAAITSFFLFAIGAIIPVLPFIFSNGFPAVVISLALSVLGLFAIGAGVSLTAGSPLWQSGGRQVLLGLLAAGMTLDWLHEHDGLTWQMFEVLVQDAERLWRWPDKPWLPLAFSLKATRR